MCHTYMYKHYKTQYCLECNILLYKNIWKLLSAYKIKIEQFRQPLELFYEV